MHVTMLLDYLIQFVTALMAFTSYCQSSLFLSSRFFPRLSRNILLCCFATYNQIELGKKQNCTVRMLTDQFSNCKDATGTANSNSDLVKIIVIFCPVLAIQVLCELCTVRMMKLRI